MYTAERKICESSYGALSKALTLINLSLPLALQGGRTFLLWIRHWVWQMYQSFLLSRLSQLVELKNSNRSNPLSAKYVSLDVSYAFCFKNCLWQIQWSMCTLPQCHAGSMGSLGLPGPLSIMHTASYIVWFYHFHCCWCSVIAHVSVLHVDRAEHSCLAPMGGN